MTRAVDKESGRIEIEIEASCKPIRGRLQDRGRTVSFSGWLGLAAALGQLMESKPAVGPNEPTRQESS